MILTCLFSHVVIWGSLEETKVRRWRLCDARDPRSLHRSWKFRHGKAHDNLPKWNAKLILHGKIISQHSIIRLPKQNALKLNKNAGNQNPRKEKILMLYIE